MGHRANFVVIRNGNAQAYYDSWAALGCVHCVADGPEDAAASAAEFDPTDELLDWAFMEGGYLIDFDEKVLIVFGLTEDDLDDEFSGLDEDDDGRDKVEAVDATGDESRADENDDDGDEWDKEAERASAAGFLQGIAPKWKGWTLRWDQRGADAFAEHLVRRGLTAIRTQPATAEDCLTVELKA
jgi:hypothetical protein